LPPLPTNKPPPALKVELFTVTLPIDPALLPMLAKPTVVTLPVFVMVRVPLPPLPTSKPAPTLKVELLTVVLPTAPAESPMLVKPPVVTLPLLVMLRLPLPPSPTISEVLTPNTDPVPSTVTLPVPSENDPILTRLSTVTLPPLVMLSFPAPSTPTRKAKLVLLHKEPVPSTVTLPKDPAFAPIKLVPELVRLPPAKMERLPLPSMPTRRLPANACEPEPVTVTLPKPVETSPMKRLWPEASSKPLPDTVK